MGRVYNVADSDGHILAANLTTNITRLFGE
jgi:hypothetical protein